MCLAPGSTAPHPGPLHSCFLAARAWEHHGSTSGLIQLWKMAPISAHVNWIDFERKSKLLFCSQLLNIPMDGTFFAIETNCKYLKIVYLMFLCFSRFKTLLYGAVLWLWHWCRVLGGVGANSDRPPQTEGHEVCQQDHPSWVEGWWKNGLKLGLDCSLSGGPPAWEGQQGPWRMKVIIQS